MLNGYEQPSSLAVYGPTVLRVTLALVFIAHGAQKLFGIWGGAGLPGTAAYVAQLGLEPSYWIAVLVGGIEFGGGLMLLAGVYTFGAAALLVLQLAAAIWFVHRHDGFFAPFGYELHLTRISALVCLMLTGAGAFSLDGRRASHAAAAAAGRARIRAGRV
jgi:putative oxidoreductase